MRRAALPAVLVALAVGALTAGGAVGASLAATGTTRAAFSSSVVVPFGPVGAAAAEVPAPTTTPTTTPTATPTATATATATPTPATPATRKHHAAEPEPSSPTAGPALSTAPASQTAGAAAPPDEPAPAEATVPTTPEATPTPS